MKEEKLQVGDYVVLHSLQQQAHLAGQLARVTKLPSSETKLTPPGSSSGSGGGGGGESSSTSDSSPNTNVDRCGGGCSSCWSELLIVGCIIGCIGCFFA
jgi:hypothetical protein